jgi:hypothetical protein
MSELVEVVNGVVVDARPLAEISAEIHAAEGAEVGGFVRVGLLLREVQQSKAYVEEFGTFEGYIEAEFGLGWRQAYYQMDAAELAVELAQIVQVPSSGVLREFASVQNQKGLKAAASAFAEVNQQYERERERNPKLRLTAKYARTALIQLRLKPGPANGGPSNRGIKAGFIFDSYKRVSGQLAKWIESEVNDNPPSVELRGMMAREADLLQAAADACRAIADGGKPNHEAIGAAIQRSDDKLMGIAQPLELAA